MSFNTWNFKYFFSLFYTDFGGKFRFLPRESGEKRFPPARGLFYTGSLIFKKIYLYFSVTYIFNCNFYFLKFFENPRNFISWRLLEFQIECISWHRMTYWNGALMWSLHLNYLSIRFNHLTEWLEMWRFSKLGFLILSDKHSSDFCDRWRIFHSTL